jgi:TadE-like protein
MRRIVARLRESETGQSMVELALILPLLLMIVLGTLEFGLIFDHHLSLEYASREGARTGSALANANGVSPACTEVDRQIVAAVERVLTSPGSEVDLHEVSEIRIYKSLANGGETPGAVNVWKYTPGTGPVVDGKALNFSHFSGTWSACGRSNDVVNPDMLGVRVAYTYRFQTPLGGLLGGASLALADRTIMVLNPR